MCSFIIILASLLEAFGTVYEASSSNKFITIENRFQAKSKMLNILTSFQVIFAPFRHAAKGLSEKKLITDMSELLLIRFSFKCTDSTSSYFL